MSPYRISLSVFALVMAGAFLILLVLCQFDQMPGPRISNSASFNQKALWLRKYFQQHNSAEIVVVGSSMGLDNIDGEELAKNSGTTSIINGSSWGLSIEESTEMVRILVEQSATTPRLVIIPVFFGDFFPGEDKNLDWAEFRKYLSSPLVFPFYLKYPDRKYYWDTYRAQQTPEALDRRIYETLHFDAFGGLPLNCDSFEYRERRWNYHQSETVENEKWDPGAAKSLVDLASYLDAKKIKMLVVACPMRQVAEKKLGAAVDSMLWRDVQSRLTASGITFVHITGNDFADSLFVDSYHLNHCGARELTRRLAPQISYLLQ